MSTDIAKEITDKLESLGRGLTDAQRAQVEDIVRANRAMRPAADTGAGDGDILSGTKYGRLGMSAGQVELLHGLTARAARVGIGNGPSETLANVTAAIRERDAELHGRAMDTAESGYGNQLIGASYASSLWEAAKPESRVAALIDSIPMNAPTAYLPVAGAPPEPILMAESTANNSSNYTTVKTGSNRVTVTVAKLGIHQMWSGEMEEDAIIPFVPFLEREAAFSLAHYTDSLVLNGDTTNSGTGNINLDDADPADTKFYLAFDGIRHAAIVDATGQTTNVAGPITWAALTKTAKASLIDTTYFTDWGSPASPGDLIYVCEPETALAIGQLDEVIKARETAPGSAMLVGEIGRIVGHPVISSMAVSKTEADGKVSTTAANNTFGQVVIFNRRAYVIGYRRQVQVELERLPATDQTRIVYTWRMGLGRYTPTGAASGIKHTAVLRNISL